MEILILSGTSIRRRSPRTDGHEYQIPLLSSVQIFIFDRIASRISLLRSSLPSSVLARRRFRVEYQGGTRPVYAKKNVSLI